MDSLEIQRAADRVAGLYQDLEERLMANIIRHIKNYDQPIASDVWLMQKLAEIGKLNKENIKIIAQCAGLSQRTVEQLLQETAEEAISRVEPGMQKLLRRGLAGEAVEPKKSKNIQKVMKAFQSQEKDMLILCKTQILYTARNAFTAQAHTIASSSAATS